MSMLACLQSVTAEESFLAIDDLPEIPREEWANLLANGRIASPVMNE